MTGKKTHSEYKRFFVDEILNFEEVLPLGFTANNASFQRKRFLKERESKKKLKILATFQME